MSQRGDWQDPMSRESLRMMKEELAASHVILPITVTSSSSVYQNRLAK